MLVSISLSNNFPTEIDHLYDHSYYYRLGRMLLDLMYVEF